jgi:Zn-dependent protease
MRATVQPSALIVAGLALLAPAWALAAEVDAFAMPADLKLVILTLPAFLTGIGLHEWGHAYVAYRLGDSTPEEEGRLSLNPLDHLDPLGTLLILAASYWHLPLIGWGKPVNIRPGAFHSPITDKMKVALAGPMMNLAIVAATLWVMIGITTLREPIVERLGPVFFVNLFLMTGTVLGTNASLALFNMLPIPPLDGSKVLENFVGYRTVVTMREIEPYGIVILYGLVNTRFLAWPYARMTDGIELMTQHVWMTAAFTLCVAGAWYRMVRSLRFR